MAYDDVITRNDDGELAVRTVSVSEGNAPANYDDVMTRDENGNLAVRVIGNGGGGGDQHNLGYYATQSALETAHPTAEAGDWAIVGATDTVWIWDTDNSEWVDSDQKGQVTSVNNQTGAVTVSEVPSQTGNAGKFLTTDGTNASWSDKPLVNTATGTNSITIGGVGTPQAYAINIGGAAQAQGNDVAIGYNSTAFGSNSIAIGSSTQIIGGSDTIAIGANVRAGAANAIQLGGVWPHNNTDANTFKVGNANGNYEIMSADGTIPADRLTHAINKYSTMPTASASNEGWIVQFTGTTGATYTHGHLYECVSDGQTPATYSWTEVQLGGGGSSYTAGTGINITSGVISVTAPTLTNNENSVYSLGLLENATASNNGVAVGWLANAGGGVAVGESSQSSGGFAGGALCMATGTNAVALGSDAIASGTSSIQINTAVGVSATNSDANTFKVANANGNFEIMSADGTIPEARLADTTNAQQGDVLTLNSNGNAVWAAGGGGSGLKTVTNVHNAYVGGDISLHEPFMCLDSSAYCDGYGWITLPIGVMCSVESYSPESTQHSVDVGSFTITLDEAKLRSANQANGYIDYSFEFDGSDWVGTADNAEGGQESITASTQQLYDDLGITVDGVPDSGDSFTVSYQPETFEIKSYSQGCPIYKVLNISASDWQDDGSNSYYQNEISDIVCGDSPIIMMTMDNVSMEDFTGANVSVDYVKNKKTSANGYGLEIRLIGDTGLTPYLNIQIVILPRFGQGGYQVVLSTGQIGFQP